MKVMANALCHTDIYTLDGHDPEVRVNSRVAMVLKSNVAVSVSSKKNRNKTQRSTFNEAK